MIPTREAVARWTFVRLPRVEGLARTIARYPGGITLMFAENSDGSYTVTKMRGGRITDERAFHNLPLHISRHLDKRRPAHERTTEVPT